MSPLWPPPTTTTSHSRAASSATGAGSPTRPSTANVSTGGNVTGVTSPIAGLCGAAAVHSARERAARLRRSRAQAARRRSRRERESRRRRRSGPGPNGLVAANRLADAGWRVLVLEAQPEPGGAVRSGELTKPGFVHDRFSAFYPLAARVARDAHPRPRGPRTALVPFTPRRRAPDAQWARRRPLARRRRDGGVARRLGSRRRRRLACARRRVVPGRRCLRRHDDVADAADPGRRAVRPRGRPARPPPVHPVPPAARSAGWPPSASAGRGPRCC